MVVEYEPPSSVRPNDRPGLRAINCDCGGTCFPDMYLSIVEGWTQT